MLRAGCYPASRWPFSEGVLKVPTDARESGSRTTTALPTRVSLSRSVPESTPPQHTVGDNTTGIEPASVLPWIREPELTSAHTYLHGEPYVVIEC